ncbi:MAG: hypothetical protein JHC93_05945 [Parachlamydiales bacterium]|nr:hypothetical protein [Parachlamydiales bacterium]
MKPKIILFIIALVLSTSAYSLDNQFGSFISPKGWKIIDKKLLPGNVKCLVQGRTLNDVPPSLNLAVENCTSSLENYLKSAKSIFVSKGDSWQQLGTIKTRSGPAALVLITQDSPFGQVRLMQAFIQQNNVIYLLTATALKEEFNKYYSDFFKAFQSFSLPETFLSDPEEF